MAETRTKRIPGFAFTVKAFIPADPNDPDSYTRALLIMEGAETALARAHVTPEITRRFCRRPAPATPAWGEGVVELPEDGVADNLLKNMFNYPYDERMRPGGGAAPVGDGLGLSARDLLNNRSPRRPE